MVLLPCRCSNRTHPESSQLTQRRPKTRPGSSDRLGKLRETTAGKTEIQVTCFPGRSFPPGLGCALRRPRPGRQGRPPGEAPTHARRTRPAAPSRLLKLPAWGFAAASRAFQRGRRGGNAARRLRRCATLSGRLSGGRDGGVRSSRPRPGRCRGAGGAGRPGLQPLAALGGLQRPDGPRRRRGSEPRQRPLPAVASPLVGEKWGNKPRPEGAGLAATRGPGLTSERTPGEGW